jgi:choline dehydrogenase-like flavoprotein
VRASSPDAAAPPIVQPNYLQAHADQRVVIDSMRFVRRIFAAPPLSSYIDFEAEPGPEVTSDEDLLAFARNNAFTAYHFSGACKMGSRSDRMAVVDDELRVIGLQGLRVVDASVLPTLVSGNTGAPVLMIAEKAADLAVICDKGYASKANRDAARDRGIAPVIPHKANEKNKPAFFARARIEQGIGRLKRVALRCEKTAQNFRSIVSFAAGLCLIKFVHTT